MRIAHLSDPHINLKYHPNHLPRLRKMLEEVICVQQADHIVISGDLTSNGDARDLRAIRRLFESLGIMSSNRLTVVAGNHDIFGGPHLAEDLLVFPETCRQCDYHEKLAIFQDTFSELFTGTIVHASEGLAQMRDPYPFLKRIRNVCFLGINSVAEYSLLENLVGSNGRIARQVRSSVAELVKHHAWQTATQRIVVMHHHLFRKRDVQHLNIADGATGSGVLSMLEQGTLKLHGKNKVLRLFVDIGVDMVLHGHVHFTGTYEREGIACLNSAGAIHPASKKDGYYYGMVDLKPYARTITTVASGSTTRVPVNDMTGSPAILAELEQDATS